MSKSYVAIEKEKCIVCGHDFDTGALLLNRQLREVFDSMGVVTGWGICPPCKEFYDDEYVALVAIDESKSMAMKGATTIKPENAYRTGEIVHLRASAFERMFNVPCRKPDGTLFPMMFVDPDVVEMLKKMQSESEEG